MRRLLPLLVFVATSALAQTPHAMLTGTVRSAKRGVAGVTVTVTSPTLQGSRTTTTVANGDYFFDALPPGTYDVQFAKKGFATVTRRGVLTVAQTARVDAELTPSQEEESITATGTTTTILETPEIATTLDSALIDQLPIRRTISDRTTLAPGDPFLRDQESVDGMLVYDPFVVEDSIDQTTVITGAAGPEYGRSLASTIITATRSGGNNVSGTLRDTLTSDRWHAAAGPQSSAIHHALEATVGGRIIADRIWFFLAGGWRHETSAFGETGFPIPGDRQTFTDGRGQAKITAAPTSWSSVVATALRISQHFEPLGKWQQNAGAIDATAMAGDHTSFEALVSRWSVPVEFFGRPANHDVLLRGSWIGGMHTVTAGYDDTHLGSEFRERAVFANDRVHAGTHWLLNAGGRVIETPFGGRFFEPRVSAIFDVHGDGHSRWSIAFGQYLAPPFGAIETNETTLSYAMQIGGNGFIRVDGWVRQSASTNGGFDFEGSYRFLGILDAGGNYTRLEWQLPRYAIARLPHNRANLWLRVAVPGIPRGTLTAGIVEQREEQYVERTTSGFGLQYAIASFFVKGDLLNAVNVREAAPREFRLSLGARY